MARRRLWFVAGCIAAAIVVLFAASFFVKPPAGAHILIPKRIRKPHILIVMIDTLRPDHLGAYGYSRNTSPNIDQLLPGGILFTNVYSVSPWTNPTIASLFTGRYPQSIFPPAAHKEAIQQVLPVELETLAERFKSMGYRTIALVDHPGISKPFHYDQGFDQFTSLYSAGGFDIWTRTSTSFVLQQFQQQIDAVSDQPLFVYLHLVYPHQPYVPAEPFSRMFGPGFHSMVPEEKQGLLNMYDGEIRQTDELLGEIMAYLKARHLLDDMYVIVTSDHGEAFWEHGLAEHGNSLFNEVLKVCLLIYPPQAKKFSTVKKATGFSVKVLIPATFTLPLVSGTTGSTSISRISFPYTSYLTSGKTRKSATTSLQPTADISR